MQISASTSYFPDSRSCNVVGIIEGSDPKLKEEAIILGAHLDAVGSPGTLFPGALDNASGSVDILAAARALAASPVKPARTIIFIFFGGEECGLYGSKTFVESHLWPKEKVVCMINLDMVGNGTGLSMANGKTFPTILTHFSDVNEKYIHRNFTATEARVNYGRPRTDGAIFEKAGYKVIHLYTSGTVKTVYYHHPLDTTDALTPEIMEDAAKLLYLGVLGLANEKSDSANYSEPAQTYRISASGSNIWFGSDSFSLLSKRMSGDFILQTRVRFIGQGHELHRKTGLMIRSSAASNSPVVACTIHGDGLTSL